MKTNGIFRTRKNVRRFLGLDTNQADSQASSDLPKGYLDSASGDAYRQSLYWINILVFDVSGSMGWTDCEPSRLGAAIKAAEAFIRKRAAISPRDLIAIVSFNTKGRIELPLIEIASTETVVMSLQKLRSGGGTDLAAGVQVAWEVLEPQLSMDRSGRILVLTDGKGGNPIKLSKKIKSQDVLIETIGFAGSESEVDASLLKKVATTDADGFSHYWFFKNTQSLVTHYEDLATGVFFRGHKQ